MSKNKIVLSNDGLKDFFKLPNRKKLLYSNKKCAITQTDMTFTLDDKLKESNADYMFIGDDTNSIIEYVKRMQEIAKRNKIVDTDKVMFLKNSTFPRISFNRYSDKAKRVQVAHKATKFVLGDDLSFWNTRKNKNYLLKGNKLKEDILLVIDFYKMATYINTETINADNKYYDFINSNNSMYYHSRKLPVPIRKDILNSLKVQLKDPSLIIEEVTYNKLRIDNITTRETFDFLLTSPDISKITSDECVNTYMSKFKGELDESNYEYLLMSLSANKNDPEVAMQLLSQLKIDKDNPLLHALFINLDFKSINNIVNHKVFKSIDIQNFIKNTGAHTYLHDSYGNNHLPQIGAVLNNKLSTPEKRALFYDKVKDKAKQAIVELTGIGEESLIKINIAYEEISNQS